jgi:hypothetical protein
MSQEKDRIREREMLRSSDIEVRKGPVSVSFGYACAEEMISVLAEKSYGDALIQKILSSRKGVPFNSEEMLKGDALIESAHPSSYEVLALILPRVGYNGLDYFNPVAFKLMRSGRYDGIFLNRRITRKEFFASSELRELMNNSVHKDLALKAWRGACDRKNLWQESNFRGNLLAYATLYPSGNMLSCFKSWLADTNSQVQMSGIDGIALFNTEESNELLKSVAIDNANGNVRQYALEKLSKG